METKTDTINEQTQDQEIDLTTVKVRKTHIKFFNEESSELREETLTGRLTLAQCSKYVKGLEGNNVVVSKKPVTETFEVSTIELLQLKK